MQTYKVKLLELFRTHESGTSIFKELFFGPFKQPAAAEVKTDEHFEDDKTTNLLVFKDNTSHHENNLSQDKGNEDVYIKVEDLEAASKQDDDKQQDTLGKSLISNLIPI